MQIILARHGNTFGPGDKIRWIGNSIDLPLVETGIKQAERFSEALIKNNITPSAIFCSPLQRTKKYAQIIIDKLNLNYDPIIDPRINEIDYGEWTNLSDEEIIKKFGEKELKDWNTKSKIPAHRNWGASKEAIISEVNSFVNDLINQFGEEDVIIIVSSNGKIRYFLNLIENEFQKRIKNQEFKVKTGNICKIIYSNKAFNVAYWNMDPSNIQNL